MMVMVRPFVHTVELLLGARIKFWRVLKIYVIYMYAIPLLDFSVQLPLLLQHSLPRSVQFDKMKTNHSTVYNDYNVDKWRECTHTHHPPSHSLLCTLDELCWYENLIYLDKVSKWSSFFSSVKFLFYFYMHFFKFRLETHSFWANKWRESGRHVTNMTAVTLSV